MSEGAALRERPAELERRVADMYCQELGINPAGQVFGETVKNQRMATVT